MTVINGDNIQERLVALTRDLMLIPSIPSRPEDRQRCYEFIRNHLEFLENIEVREYNHEGIPSLVAAPKGCTHPDILMCGHLDVITHPDVSLYRSHIQDGRIYGPGSGDMKGALAILLEVFRNIHSRLPHVSLGIAVTSDEETGGEAGIGFLFKETGMRCKLAMIPDGGSIDEITIEEKGILHLYVSCAGHSAHAARPWLGNNPIDRLMEKLTALKSFFRGLNNGQDNWYPTCAITIIGTENQQTNRIASNAHAVLDIRFPPPFTVEEMIKKIKEIMGRDAAVETIISAEPTHLTPDPEYQKVTEELTGGQVRLVKEDGGSDARHITPYGIPVMISRPVVGNLHAEDEWIDIASMVKLYTIYETYLMQKLGGG